MQINLVNLIYGKLTKSIDFGCSGAQLHTWLFKLSVRGSGAFGQDESREGERGKCYFVCFLDGKRGCEKLFLFILISVFVCFSI